MGLPTLSPVRTPITKYTFDPAVVEQKIAELQAAAGEKVKVHYGCDFHLTMENIQAALADPARYSINHKGYLLVEFADFAIPQNTWEIFASMIRAGLRPIVTHPERNPLLQKRIADLEEWVNMGCLMQVTGLSLTGRFGRSAKLTADQMMEQGLVHVLASDAHDTVHRPPVLDGIYRQVEKDYGETAAHALLKSNPAAVIAGKPLPSGRVVMAKKKWYQRF
jgi:protein-tyrosine phosphatase